MRRTYFLWIFFAALVGLVFSVAIRGVFDGVALLFTIIAVLMLALDNYFDQLAYIEVAEQQKRLDAYLNHFDEARSSRE